MQPSAPLSDMESVICPNCGASLSYKPGTTQLVCEHCGSTVDIQIDTAAAKTAKQEKDLEAALAGNWQASQSQGQAYVVKCPACNAESALEKNLFSSKCAFCGSPITVTPDARAVANPQALLPFKLEKQTASQAFNKWLRKLWFAPNDLKKTAAGEGFNGIYLPYWTFDAQTQSDYRGERGTYYYETRRRVVNGREQTDRVRKTRWFPASGHVSRGFDDILITASQALPEKYLNHLEPWDLADLAPYDMRFLTGFQAEVCQVDIRSGFEEAKQVMAETIEKDVHEDIGGDEQRISSLQTFYNDLTYKYILLPVWLSVYRYSNKVYRFVVNARTGEVHGERPWSWIKITLAVLVGLLIVGLLIYFSSRR